MLSDSIVASKSTNPGLMTFERDAIRPGGPTTPGRKRTDPITTWPCDGSSALTGTRQPQAQRANGASAVQLFGSRATRSTLAWPTGYPRGSREVA